MLRKAYDLIMDDNKNAFSSLPKSVRFQLMTALAYMWCAIFSFGTGYYLFFGTSLVFHLLFIIGLFFTADLFSKARENKISSVAEYRDHRAAFKDEDGAARYDDMWGGI